MGQPGQDRKHKEQFSRTITSKEKEWSGQKVKWQKRKTFWDHHIHTKWMLLFLYESTTYWVHHEPGKLTMWLTAKIIRLTSTLRCQSIGLNRLVFLQAKAAKRQQPSKTSIFRFKMLLLGQYESKRMIPLGEKLKEFVNEWTGLTQDISPAYWAWCSGTF